MSDVIHARDDARASASQLTDFARFAGAPQGDFAALHAFSVEDIARFWTSFMKWSGVVYEGALEPALSGVGIREAKFFPNVRLSWAENLLANRDGMTDDDVAIVAVDETGARVQLTRGELRAKVRRVASALEARGLREGDRVAAVVRNTADAVVACLAVTSLGATWSSVAPDMGVETALARFGQIEPKMLVTHRTAPLNGAKIDVPVSQIVAGLPTVTLVVEIIDGVSASSGLPSTTLEALEREGASAPIDAPWKRFAFDHPLFVLFSSGTTGAPKCIVHGHGGSLVEHLKEHRLHVDLRRGDRMLFQTATGWMMWNWLVSALASGAAIVLYDGSVTQPERDSLLRVAGRERVTVFGTSPAYLQYLLDAGVHTGRELLRDVREMLSTGSVLHGHLHRFAKEHVCDVPLQSISGGTDILGCFVLGSPWTPTIEGASSCKSLGLDVRAMTDDDARPDGRGELVCVQPFPSRPVGFLADPEGARYRDAYFAQHEGVWTHGDLVDIAPSGSVRVLGRCDGVLNIRGIRIGPSEIYDVLARAVPEVSAAMAVDQDAPLEPGGKKLVLFVVPKSGVALDRALSLRIKKELKQRASAAHVPALLVAVDDLPTTFSGKRSEAALQDALNGRTVRNKAALRNPGSIDAALAAIRAL